MLWAIFSCFFNVYNTQKGFVCKEPINYTEGRQVLKTKEDLQEERLRDIDEVMKIHSCCGWFLKKRDNIGLTFTGFLLMKVWK